MEAEVCIIGGGPGGSSAALQLSRHGIPCLLLDRSVFPRDKVCGDALSGKVMRTLERLDDELATRLSKDARVCPSWGVTFVAPGGKALRVPFSRNIGEGEAPGAILPRMDLDDLLFQKAKGAPGVTVLEGAQAHSYERTPKGWAIGFKGPSGMGTCTCRLVLDASGANSGFARHVAQLPMEPRHHAAGVRAYYEGVTGLDPDGFIELHFLKDLLPGYLWIFPLAGGRANVGLGLRSNKVRERRLDLKAELQRLVSGHPTLKDRFAQARATGPIQGMGLPLASRRRRISGEGYLLIGDAAHLIDPFTGEGISHAMMSGVYAADTARTLLEAKDLSAKAARSYDRRVWARLGQELSISTRLQRLANKAWLFDLVVDRASRNPALADTIGCMFTDLDLRARLKKPGFYWDLLRG